MPPAVLYIGGIEVVSSTETYLFLETKFILTKIHLFIKRCRDAKEKVIRMTRCVHSSQCAAHKFLGFDLAPRAK